MDGEWLNRLGIVLNFVAGILIAPELIGRDRIRRAEERIERASEALPNRFGGVLEDEYNPVPEGMSAIVLGVLTPSLVWWRLLVERGVTAGWLVLPVIVLYGALIVFGNTPERDVIDASFSFLGILSTLLVTGALVWAIGVRWTLIVVLVVIIGNAVMYVRDMWWEWQKYGEIDVGEWAAMSVGLVITWPMLVGMSFVVFVSAVVVAACRGALWLLGPQHRLEGYLVAAGLTCLVVGNAMQLIATF
jgi:hypothetical protein